MGRIKEFRHHSVYVYQIGTYKLVKATRALREVYEKHQIFYAKVKNLNFPE